MDPKAPDALPADLKLVAHPRAKSKVWKYFGFDADAEGCIVQWKRIYCRICLAQIAYSGNTSNLSYHLEKNHAEEFCEFVKSNTEHMREAFASAFAKLRPEATSGTGPPVPTSPQQPPPLPAPGMDTMVTVASKPVSPGSETRRQQELTAAVGALICDGLYPPAIVDEPAFRALLRTAEPRYELPPRSHFLTRVVPERYAAVREAVLRDLAAASWCGVSLELWRSDTQNRRYVTLAAHFLNVAAPSGPALGSRCLTTFEVPEEDTAETVTRALYEAFVEWGLGAKVAGATTDGGKDLARACSLLDVPVHMPCLGQSFERALGLAFRLPRLGALLARCRRLVAYFQQSPVAMLLLAERRRDGSRHLLVSDRAGGWGRTLAMLQSLREHQAAIAGVLVEDSHSHHLMLEAAEWAAVDALAELLAAFRQVAEVLVAARPPTVSMVKPLLHVLLGTALAAKDADGADLAAAKEVIARELARTYRDAPDVDLFLNVATFLDPRYKRLPFLSAFERQQVEGRVADEAKALLDRADAGSPPSPPTEDPDLAEEPPAKRPTVGEPASAVHAALAEIFRPAGGGDPQEERRAQVLEELSNYKSQKALGLREDPLRWWGERRALFPLLPRILRKYWCVPPTRVPPERLFGPAATAVPAKRNRLAPAHVDRQVFLYENARVDAPEPPDEDEGRWGLDRTEDPALPPGGGDGGLGIRDAGFL
ncbi:E3 SUMO-protein ligase ZBED1 [Ctenodactylus gundi]